MRDPMESIKARMKTIRKDGQEILFGVEHKNPLQAIASDMTDIIPVVGDIGNVSRTFQSYKKEGFSGKTKRQLGDAVVGSIPVVGEIADALTPTNIINYAKSHGANVPELPNIPIPGEKIRPPEPPKVGEKLRAKGWPLPKLPGEN